MCHPSFWVTHKKGGEDDAWWRMKSTSFLNEQNKAMKFEVNLTYNRKPADGSCMAAQILWHSSILASAWVFSLYRNVPVLDYVFMIAHLCSIMYMNRYVCVYKCMWSCLALNSTGYIIMLRNNFQMNILMVHFNQYQLNWKLNWNFQ